MVNKKILVLTLIILVFVVVVLVNFLPQEPKVTVQTESPELLVDSPAEPEATELLVEEEEEFVEQPLIELKVAGVVRGSGLSIDEKSNLFLKYSHFQLTQLDQAERKRLNTSADGFYFETEDNLAQDYLGKCVLVTVEIEPDAWHQIPSYGPNRQYTYGRIFFIPYKIEELDYKHCNPYPEQEYQLLEEEEKILVTGILEHTDRPAPDINYDYLLKETNISFFYPHAQSEYYINIIPTSNLIWQKLEENIGKVVAVEGVLNYGYTDTPRLLLISIIE